MFILLLEYTKPIEYVEKHLVAHREYLDIFCRSHNIIVAGKKKPRTGGVIIVRGMGRTEVERLIAEDPFTMHGVGEYTLIEFEPTVHDPDFGKFL